MCRVGKQYGARLRVQVQELRCVATRHNWIDSERRPRSMAAPSAVEMPITQESANQIGWCLARAMVDRLTQKYESAVQYASLLLKLPKCQQDKTTCKKKKRTGKLEMQVVVAVSSKPLLNRDVNSSSRKYRYAQPFALSLLLSYSSDMASVLLLLLGRGSH